MNDDRAVFPQYEKLAGQEAKFWGAVRPRADNPQLWDDPRLFDLFMRPQWEHLIQSVVSAGGNVLELGCGEGHLAMELAKRGLNVKGLDISDARIAKARLMSRSIFENNAASAPSFEVADLNTVQLTPNAYDVIVVRDALHHVLRLDRLLGEVASALTPAGRFIAYDYVGMGRFRKVLAGLLYGVLPTYQSYAAKLRLAGRLPAFLSGEEGKRKRLERDAVERHAGTPFEEISQESIIPLIAKNFTIIEWREDHPFFFYLAPKVRCPESLKSAFWRTLHGFDAMILASGVSRGAYVYVNAAQKT